MIKVFSTTKNLLSSHEQGADFVELFFDLVFVYAITRITAVTAHHLDIQHVLQSVLVFWLIWWGWTQFTWTLNTANTKIAEIRMGVLVTTGVAFVLASSVDEAFTDGVLWFAIPYIIIRLLGLGLQIRVSSNSKEERSAAYVFAAISLTGLIAVFGGAMVDPMQRVWWWLAAIGLDMAAGFIGGRSEGWSLRAKHFAERHSLIVIIALGESLIVAASAIDVQERSQDLMIVGGLAVLVTCLLWWSYFSWINEYLEEHFSKKSGSEQARLGRDAYSLMHFPLVCGIIGIAIGFEKIIGNPNDLLSFHVAAALSIGYILFVGFTAAAVWRSSKLLLVPRITILLVSATGIFLSIGKPSYLAFVIIAVSLTLLIFIEWKKCRLS
ncbi:MAG: hypothetical protein GQ564_10695 [Bacteroidales bacterium]|nr:hypothetical protein [Bacteroidales bacterium]